MPITPSVSVANAENSATLRARVASTSRADGRGLMWAKLFELCNPAGPSILLSAMLHLAGGYPPSAPDQLVKAPLRLGRGYCYRRLQRVRLPLHFCTSGADQQVLFAERSPD